MYLAVVAVLLSTDNIFYLVPLWFLAGLVVSALFIIAHDAAHQSLFKKQWMCDWVGRITMLPALHIYSVWILRHNHIHHAFTMHQERDFVWHPYSPAEFEDISRTKKLMHRLEWSCLGAGIYYLVEVWWKKMIAFRAPAKRARDIGRDRLFLIGGLSLGILSYYLFAVLIKNLSGGMAIAYAGWLVLKVLLIPWLLFNHFIGLVLYVQHIQPELKWHTHKAWTKFKAQMKGTMIFRVSPKLLNIFLHDCMIHAPHHVDMRIPFYNLHKAAEHIHNHYPGTVRDLPIRLRHYLRATRLCKLYDFEAERWLDYQGNPAAGSRLSPG
jgi:omega-6 fatty acid desaturase (delta-12 desaturase)